MISELNGSASPWHGDDAMIRRLRMTVAQLAKHLDRRFTRLERRMAARFAAVDDRFAAVDGRFLAADGRFDAHDARFSSLERHLISLGDKLDSITRRLDGQYTENRQFIDEHEKRLQDLEQAERSRARSVD